MQSYSKIHEDSDLDDPDDNRTETIKKRHQRELQRAERQNRENTSAVLELRDMEDELHTLLNLFTEQRDAIETMKSSYEKSELHEFTDCGREYLQEALRRLEEYDKSARDMITRVDATRTDVSIYPRDYSGIYTHIYIYIDMFTLYGKLGFCSHYGIL